MRTRRRFEVLACMLLASTLVMTSFAAKDRASDDPPGNSGGINPITHLPEPESFSERLYTVPDPFTSWEGTKVKPKDWDARAAQLRQIIEHYETGYMPSTDGITVALAITRAQNSYTAPRY